MKFPRYPNAEAMKALQSAKLTDAAALVKETLARHLPGGVDTPLGGLSSLFTNRTGAADSADPSAPAGSSFAEQSFTHGGRTLHYRLYRPASAKQGMPLVVMLHGCTQSAEDFARGTKMNKLAEAQGFLVAYPSQTQAANAQKCWNWFKPSDQQRDRGEPALIAGLTRQIIAEQGCDPSRVYIAGLSAGGAAAAVMASEYPDLYAAVGIHSGLPCGAARDVSTALMAMKQGHRPAAQRGTARFVPVITFHGDRDDTVAQVNSQNIIAAAAQAAGTLSIQIENGEAEGGRSYTREVSLNDAGEAVIEQWTIHGGGHAWSGGSAAGTYTDGRGPDASAAMMRFFLAHQLR